MEQAFERRPWLLPLSLAILTLIFLRPVIIPPEAGSVLDGQDFRAMFYPLQQSIQQTLQSGELPLWNVHQFLGHPYIGNPHSALFYPASWFMWIVGVQRGMNLMMAFHTWLAAWGMARLLRTFRATYIGGLLAGVIYAMSGWAAARYYIGHYNLTVVFAWIPWSMIAYRHALAQKTWRALLPGVAVIGIALLAGHPPITVYMGILLASLWVYHVAQAKNPDMRRAAWYAGWRLAAMLIGGAILGAALVLPAAELTQVSARTGNDLAFANSVALPPAQYLDLALPGFFGNPKVGPYYYWGADFFEEFMAYAGLLPLLAIPLAFRWRRREAWYFLGLVALGLVLAVGLDGALMPLLFRWVPGFGLFRTPGRSLYLVMVGMAGLTALLVSALQRSTHEERREALRPAVHIWIPAAAVIAFVGAIYFAGWYSSASHVEPMPIRAFVDSGSLAMAGVILLGVWVVLWLWSDGEPKSAQWALLLTFGLVTLDAWHVGIPIMTVSVYHEDSVWAGARSHIPLGPDARVVAPAGLENLASVTGLLNVAGYDPLPVEALTKLEAMTDAADPSAPVNTLLGVKYFLTTKPYDKPNWELLGIADNGIYYRRKDPFPRAWIAKNVVVEGNDDATRLHIASGKENLQDTVYVDRPFDCPSAGGTATITSYRPNDVSITTSGAGGLLTFSDQYYPGWQASVDGSPVDIVRADTVFRAICVPPGDHTVLFEYRPKSLYIGLALSIVGWLAMLGLVITGLFARRVTLGAT